MEHRGEANRHSCSGAITLAKFDTNQNNTGALLRDILGLPGGQANGKKRDFQLSES